LSESVFDSDPDPDPNSILMFFIHKYSPKTCHDIEFNKEEIRKIDIMCKDPAFPNMIVYGPPGSGKKTIINFILKKLYGDSVDNLKETTYAIPNGNSTSKLTFKQSNYHIVIEPKNNAFDRHLIQGVTKEYAKRNPISIIAHNKPFKVIIIDNVDNLSYYAQTSLRRTMERYSGVCRFIMCCRNLSKVIDPLRSRCQLFRIKKPPNHDVIRIILDVANQEGISIDFEKCSNIIEKSGGNVKKVLWSLQMLKYGDSIETKYDKSIDKLVDNILSYDIQRIGLIKKITISLLKNDIGGSKIIEDVVDRIIDSNEVSNKCKLDIMFLGAKYEHRVSTKQKCNLHLEAFFIGAVKAIVGIA